MPDDTSRITCAVCGSTHTSVREVDTRDRMMWVDCLDCQRFSPQPYPVTPSDRHSVSAQTPDRGR